MKKTMINETHIEGLLYEHNLERKVSGENSKNPGTPFISGTISIATDNECLNVIQVHYTYVTEVTSKGNTNKTYTTLESIIDGKIGTVMKDTKENAGKIKVDSAIGLNEFYSDRSGKEELVSIKRNEGGFVHVVDGISEDEKLRNTFKVDMLITSCKRIEADEEKNTPEKLILKGATFDFRKALLPIELSVLNPNAMGYFETLNPSSKEPVFTKVWGRQQSQTVVKRTVEESAFGEASIRETTSTYKDFVVTGASKDTYEWDSEDTILASELNTAMTERETMLAAMKKRQDEYQSTKAATKTAPAVPAAGNYSF